MSKDGYYGDFESFAEENEARMRDAEKCKEEDELSFMMNSIDSLICTFGYDNVMGYILSTKNDE